jgi:hypothetical protein
MAFWLNFGLNRRDRLGGLPRTAAAQSFDFVDLG